METTIQNKVGVTIIMPGKDFRAKKSNLGYRSLFHNRCYFIKNAPFVLPPK